VFCSSGFVSCLHLFAQHSFHHAFGSQHWRVRPPFARAACGSGVFTQHHLHQGVASRSALLALVQQKQPLVTMACAGGSAEAADAEEGAVKVVVTIIMDSTAGAAGRGRGATFVVIIKKLNEKNIPDYWFVSLSIWRFQRCIRPVRVGK